MSVRRVALKRVYYNGRHREPGEEFNMRPNDAKAHQALKNVGKAAEPVRATRTYRRRDMQAAELPPASDFAVSYDDDNEAAAFVAPQDVDAEGGKPTRPMRTRRGF